MKSDEKEWLLGSLQPTNFENVQEVKIDVEWCVKDLFFMPAEYAAAHADEERAKCQLTVYVQNNKLDQVQLEEELKSKMVVLTVHDVGTNPLHSFIPSVNSGPMAQFREKTVFLHVCLPGQESLAKNFHGSYPTMEQMAEIMPQVLDHFRLQKCFAIGEGAGADVICRFALESPDMLSGILLVHCTSATHGIIDNLKEILTNFQIEDGKMNIVAWDFLLAHKFGEHMHKDRRQQCIDQIRRIGLNEYNLSRLLYSFSYRTDFMDLIKQNFLKIHAILLTGSKSPHNKSVFHMYEQMDKSRTTLLVAEDSLDLLNEAPEYVAQALTLLASSNHRNSGMNNRNEERNNCSDASTSLQSFDMDTGNERQGGEGEEERESP